MSIHCTLNIWECQLNIKKHLHFNMQLLQLTSTQLFSLHVLQTIEQHTVNACCTRSLYIAAIFLLKPIVYMFFYFASSCTMKCNMCTMETTFRARDATIGGIFVWWCQSCYDAHPHTDLPHDKNFPIMCHKCNEQPATCRAKTKLTPDWLYWCYSCYERQSDPAPFEDTTVVDLDDASDEDGHDVASDEDEHGVHADDGTHSCSSFNSWHLPLSHNLQALELQSHDDNASMSSSQSFMLAYQVLENDDNASMSSFQMVSVADPDEQQEQHQQQGQEHQQQCDHGLHEPEQEPVESNVADVADVESNVAEVGSVLDDDQGIDQASDQQPDAQGIHQASELAKWREEQEVLIAIEVSMHEEQLQIAEAAAATAAAKAAVADNSNSKGSSSNSSSSNSMPTLAATLFTQKLPKRTQKKPRWPLSDFQIKPSRLPSAFTVHKTGLEAIPEVHVDEALQMSEYVDSSGCTQAVFTDGSIMGSPVPMCPIHLLDYQPNCRECVNHQFFQAKHNHDVQLTQAIEQSMKTSSSKIIYTDGLPCCSMHDDSMQQGCHTCNQVLLLRDELSAFSLRMKNLKQ